MDIELLIAFGVCMYNSIIMHIIQCKYKMHNLSIYVYVIILIHTLLTYASISVSNNEMGHPCVHAVMTDTSTVQSVCGASHYRVLLRDFPAATSFISSAVNVSYLSSASASRLCSDARHWRIL